MDIKQKMEILQNCLNLVNAEIDELPVDTENPVLIDLNRKARDRYERITTGVKSLQKELAIRAARA